MMRETIIFLLAFILSCTNACTRHSVQASVLTYINGDTSPLLVGYDEDQPWQYEVLNSAWANNGQISGLTFSTQLNGPVYIRQRRSYEVQACNVLQLSLVAQFNVFNVYDTILQESVSRFENQPYYGCGIFQASDSATGLLYGFVLTNSMIYGLYGRDATVSSTYASFLYLVPIFTRLNPLQYNVLQLAFDKANNSVIYRVDGSDRLLMDISGKRINSQYLVNSSPSGSEELAFPQSLQISLGIMQLGLLHPASTLPGPPCVSPIFDYCDCQQNLVTLQNQPACQYNPVSQYLSNMAVNMTMQVASIQANRMLNIKPVCKCGESESDSLSSCSAPSDHPVICRPSSSSGSSTSDACKLDSSDFSFW